MSGQKFSVILGLLAAVCGVAAGAEEDLPEDRGLLEMSLAQLMEVEVGVASKTETSLRESPGIVSVISEEEIVHSGARDLVEVLRLVPGFHFGVDVTNAVGAGLRGNWAYEGKLLIMLDGVEMTEFAFGNTLFGNHFPVDHIQRIEIIRGPGSVLYGGFAEVGVINIISKNAAALEGGEVSVAYGRTRHTTAHRQASLRVGDTSESGIRFSALLYAADGHRGDGVYTDFAGTRVDTSAYNELKPRFANLSVEYKGLLARLIVDRNHLGALTDFGEVYPDVARIDSNFDNLVYALEYRRDLSEDWKVSSFLHYADQSPWQEHMDNERIFDYRTSGLKAGAHLTYAARENLQLTVGGEFTRHTLQDLIAETRPAPFRNASLFAEGLYKSELGNLTLGLRYDRHNQFGSKLIPRVALTKVLGPAHFKAIYSHSFRTPTLGNYEYNPDIQPETTRGVELETGYRFNEHLALTLNLFNLSTRDFILYDVVPGTDMDSYYNGERFTSRGLETELRLRQNWGYLTLNYSYYRAAENRLDKYKAIDFQTGDEHPGVTLAFPAHTATLNAHVRLGRGFSLNPSLAWYGARYGYTGTDAEERPVLSEFSPSLLANLFLRWEPAAHPGLAFGVGVYNLLDERVDFIQPYNGGHAPLPGLSREWRVKVEYRF